MNLPQQLEMTFDPNVITHLGINMYSTLPPVIAELIANAYDAEATEVKVMFFDGDDNKEIQIVDNGHGMSFDEINDNFLQIGRNRRESDTGEYSQNKKRKVIGKKGLGKLAFFGIAENIVIDTVKAGIRNVFELDWNDLQEQGKKNKKYNPKIIHYNVNVSSSNGTIIHLKKLKRKTHFDLKRIAVSLSKYFTVFDEKDFNVTLFLNNEEKMQITNSLKYSDVNPIYKWNIPEDISDENLKKYFTEKKINGKFFYSEKTIREQDRGIVLYSRGKLVNEPSFFDVKATSHGYAYITGYLNVDFIDEEKEELISTNRQSLNWEYEITAELKKKISEVLQKFYNNAKQKKEDRKKEEFENKYSLDIENWLHSLPENEKKLARKIINSIIGSEGIEDEKSVELIKFTIDSFRFESFKELAHEIENSSIDDYKIIQLFKEWKIIENREFYKLAIGRVKTINKFLELIEKNAKEVQEIHPFFEKFPWILDPRINMFRHEVQYAKILKESYPEKELEEKNRRIDFLCTSVSEHKFIIELKRPHYTISYKDLEQAKDYRSFLEEHLGNTPKHPHKVVAYVVGGKIKYDDRKTRDEIDSLQQSDKVYVKTYTELLTEAKNYHEEFIRKYEEMNS